MQLILIPDVHGQREMLERLLETLECEGLLQGRRLAFLGDYVDRGPDVRGTLDLMIRLVAQGHIAIAGNHDLVLSMVLAQNTQGWEHWVRRWTMNYEDKTCESYGVRAPQSASGVRAATELRQAIPAEHREFLASLPLYYEDDRFVLVHAGLSRVESWETQRDQLDRREVIGRGPPQVFSPELARQTEHPAQGKLVASGHHVFHEPRITASRAQLNCGADVGGPLIAWVSDLDRIVQVSPRTSI